jgi:hypothetical protein
MMTAEGTARPAGTHESYRPACARAPRGSATAGEWPPRALAVAQTRPRGPTGRVGAGPEVRASPEMRPGSHDDWAATPKRASVTHKDAVE